MAYFLVVEVPDSDSPMAALSRSLPGTVMEAVLEAPARGATTINAICELCGGHPGDLKLLAEGLRGADPGARLLPAPAGCMRLAVRFPITGIAPVWKALARFAAANGLKNVWATLEEGVTFVRILAPNEAIGRLADDAQAMLRHEGFDADVATEAVQGADIVDRMTAMSEALGRFTRGAPEGF